MTTPKVEVTAYRDTYQTPFSRRSVVRDIWVDDKLLGKIFKLVRKDEWRYVCVVHYGCAFKGKCNSEAEAVTALIPHALTCDSVAKNPLAPSPMTKWFWAKGFFVLWGLAVVVGALYGLAAGVSEGENPIVPMIAGAILGVMSPITLPFLLMLVAKAALWVFFIGVIVTYPLWLLKEVAVWMGRWVRRIPQPRRAYRPWWMVLD